MDRLILVGKSVEVDGTNRSTNICYCLFISKHNGIFITLGYLLWLRPILYSKVWQHQFWADYCEITEAHHHIHIHPVLFPPIHISVVSAVYIHAHRHVRALFNHRSWCSASSPPLRRRWMRLIARPCLSPFFSNIQTHAQRTNNIPRLNYDLVSSYMTNESYFSEFQTFCLS